MSRRLEILGRLKTLEEINSIMGSLKSISLMETHRIARFLASQQQVVRNIEAAASDFLHFFPAFRGQPPQETPVYLLIGSERGFCGDFNQSLLKELDALQPRESRVIAVGRKLCLEAGGKRPSAILLGGASVAEEVHDVLTRLVEALSALPGGFSLTVLHHENTDGGIKTTLLLPPFRDRRDEKPPAAFPPRLLLEPEQFFQELVRHYLFAALHEVFYTSLMAEHQQRARHLEGAVRRLDEQAAGLLQKSNVLRQEEITEEIEEIMLGTTGLQGA